MSIKCFFGVHDNKIKVEISGYLRVEKCVRCNKEWLRIANYWRLPIKSGAYDEYQANWPSRNNQTAGN